MQRVKPVDEADASEQVLALWDGVEKLLGRVPNAWRVLAHSPDVAAWLLPFCATLHRSGTGSVTDVRMKNLVAMKTSMINKCAYCSSHNQTFGKGLGWTDEQIAVLDTDDYRTSDLFDEREKAVIWWADEVTRTTAKYNTACFENLQRHFSEPEIVELTLIAGLFALFNRFNDSLHIDLEAAEATSLINKTRTLPRKVVHEYARATAVEADGG